MNKQKCHKKSGGWRKTIIEVIKSETVSYRQLIVLFVLNLLKYKVSKGHW